MRLITPSEGLQTDPATVAHGMKRKVDFEKPIKWEVIRGKTAIITGGASGIGLAIATTLAINGARVVLLGTNDASGLQAQQDLTSRGFEAKFIHADVTDWESQLAAFKDTLAWSGGRLDIVVTSAGVRAHNIEHLILGQQQGTETHADPVKPPMDTFDVNLTGTFYSTYLALTYFTRLTGDPPQGELPLQPQLLLINSMSGYLERTLAADYVGSKHGVRGIWKAIRHNGELFGNCQANMLAPTLIDTPMVLPAIKKHLQENGITMGTVDDVVAGAMRCICDDAVESKSTLSSDGMNVS